MMAMGQKRKRSIGTIIATILLILGAIIIMIPLLWCISTALKTPREVFLDNWLPEKPMWSNFRDAVTAIPFMFFFRNTLTILIPVMIGTLVSNSLVAYGFARLKVPKKDFLFMLVIGTMLLPGQVTMIPQFLIYQYLGWVNSFKPLIIPSFFGSAFNIFLLRQFMTGIPYELDEAATIDGAGRFVIFYKIIIPLIRPALTAISIFTLTGVWNDYQGPLIYLSDMNKYTLAIGISMFKGKYSVEWNMMMAATILVILPILIIFFAAQKYFIEGITLTGLKG